MKFLIADDHDLFRDGLRLLLEGSFSDAHIDEAANFPEAFAKIQADAYTLILTDLGMPGMNGEEGVKSLLQAAPDMKVVVISARENPDEIDRMLALGIAGYIPKSSTSDLTLGAIRLALSGGIYLPPVLIQENSTTATYIEPDVQDTDPLEGLPLTPRQKEITELLATGKSNAIIAYELGISEGTVRIHVSAVLRALGVYNRTQVAAVVADHKYKTKS